MKNWNNKTVIVTGAGTGVGKGLCYELASRGAIVYVTARSLEKCQPAVDEINALGFIAHAAKLEVGNFEEFKKVINHVKEKHGQLDVLINNAARVFVGEFYDMEEHDIEDLVHTNLTGVLVGSLYAYQLMKEQGFGMIVNVSSMGGFLPNATMTAYAATKHGLIGLGNSLAAEAHKFGVSVKTLCLGLVESEMLNKAITKKGDGNIVYEMVGIKPMPTAKAVKVLVDGMAKKRRLIFVPAYAKFYYFFNRFFPSLVFKGAVQTMKKYREIIADKTNILSL